MRSLWAALLASLILTAPLAAKEMGMRQDEGPITIQGNSLTFDRNQSVMAYQGDVQAVYGDIVMVCDSLKAFLDPKTQSVSKILAAGNVKVVYQNMVVKCGKATFFPSTRQMIFEEEPVLFKGKSSLMGSKILVDFLTNRMKVLSDGDEKVNIKLFQESTRTP
jgi:lipopolysaccharide transport protein LptA